MTPVAESPCPLTICSESAESTAAIGYRIGVAALSGQLIALRGPLGAGKTQLVKGIAQGMGIEQPVTSPTFVLVNEYVGDRGRLIHIDTYRLSPDSTPDAASALLEGATFGLEDILAESDPRWQARRYTSTTHSDPSEGAIVVIEWAERISDILPVDHLQITFRLFPDRPQRRSLEIIAFGESSQDLLRALTD